MKNKFLLAASGSLIAGALLVSLAAGTAFAQTTTTNPPQNGGWSGSHTGTAHPGMKPAVFGTVSAINGDTLTVTSKMGGPRGANGSSTSTAAPVTTTYTVDATNATVFKNNATSSLSSVAVNDTVMVMGTVSGTSVTATTIRDGVMPMMGGRGKGFGPGGPNGTSTMQMHPAGASIQGNGEPVVGGNVTAINGSTLTVLTAQGNISYSVDASSATVDKGNATSSLSAIAVGDNVTVQGAVNGTSVTASSIIDSGAPKGSSTGVPAAIGGFVGKIGGFFQHIFGFF